jgi:hypothetical protein
MRNALLSCLACASLLGMAPANAACGAQTCIDIDANDGAKAATTTSGDASRAPAKLVRSVAIEGGWSGKLNLPLQTCAPLTSSDMLAAMETLQSAINRDQTMFAGRDEAIEVLYIDVRQQTFPRDPSVCQGADETVAIVFRPYHIRMSADGLASNLLSVPRLPLAQPQEEESVVQRVLRPSFAMGYDRAFGSDITAAAQPRIALGEGMTLTPTAQVRKSIDSAYFESSADMQMKVRTTNAWLPAYRFHLGGEQARTPLGDSVRSRSTVEFGGGVTAKPFFATQLFLDSSARHADDSLVSGNASTSNAAASGRSLNNRVLIDYLTPATTGLLRGAVWQSTQHLSADTSFRQLVARIGYSQEIPLWQVGQSLGFELVAGGGKLWGNAPAANRYFGGGSPVQFMYDDPISTQMQDMPAGPALRSAGQAQAGLDTPAGRVGARAFWHVNLTLALPVPAWSRPLIPDEATDIPGANDKPATLKQILNAQVDVTGPSLMERSLVAKGANPAEARAQAQKAFAEVRPAAHFIINDANIFAIRPLIMVDAAGLSGDEGKARWLAAGVGVSVTMVTARLEAGYMRTVSAPSAEKKSGALFARLVFENIFR